MPNPLFGGQERKFTSLATERTIWIVPEGNTLTGSLPIEANVFPDRRKLMGYEIGFNLLNCWGTPRTASFVIRNATTGVTLASGNKTLNQYQGTSETYFFPLELVKPLDIIWLDIGNEGVGTAAGALVHGNMALHLSAVYRMEDAAA